MISIVSKLKNVWLKACTLSVWQARPIPGGGDSTAALPALFCALQAQVLQTLTSSRPLASSVRLITQGTQASASAGLPGARSGSAAAAAAVGMSLTAMLRVASVEYPAVRFGTLDVGLGFPGQAWSADLDSLPGDAPKADVYSTSMQGNSWIAPKLLVRPAPAQGLQRLGPSDAVPGVSEVLQGSVLITGGLGSVGSLVATWVAEHSSAHLWLLGRSGRMGSDSSLRLGGANPLGGAVTILRSDVSTAEEAACAVQGSAWAAGSMLQVRTWFKYCPLAHSWLMYSGSILNCLLTQRNPIVVL